MNDKVSKKKVRTNNKTNYFLNISLIKLPIKIPLHNNTPPFHQQMKAALSNKTPKRNKF
jgi:hypothetical protein